VVRDQADSIANGEIAMLWLGNATSPQIIDDLYGVETLEEIDIRMVSHCER
jgi:protein transport protein SEC24